MRTWISTTEVHTQGARWSAVPPSLPGTPKGLGNAQGYSVPMLEGQMKTGGSYLKVIHFLAQK